MQGNKPARGIRCSGPPYLQRSAGSKRSGSSGFVGFRVTLRSSNICKDVTTLCVSSFSYNCFRWRAHSGRNVRPGASGQTHLDRSYRRSSTDTRNEVCLMVIMPAEKTGSCVGSCHRRIGTDDESGFCWAKTSAGRIKGGIVQ